MRSLVIVGQSHVYALRAAAEQHLVADGELPGTCAFVLVDFYGDVRIWKSDTGSWSTETIPQWDPAKGQCRPLAALIDEADCVAVLWAGNQLAQRALIASEVQYDVVCDSHVPTEDRVLVPASGVAAVARERITQDGRVEQILSMCRSAKTSVVVFLGPPPPLPGPATKERLAKGPWFVSQAERLNLDLDNVPIEEDSLRVRLWKIMIDEYRRFAVENGCFFFPPPPDTQEPDGTLAAVYWPDDPTHGNAAYGAVYLGEFLDWTNRMEVVAAPV